jgi:MFS family permease
MKADSVTRAEAGPQRISNESLLGRQRAVLVGLLLGASIVVVDFFIVLACLPGIERNLAATRGQLQLIVAGYAIANGCFLILGGRLGDMLGRKRVYAFGVIVFALASAGCGLSASAVSLVAFRVLQGLGGAMLQPQVLGLLTLNFGESNRARVFGWYAASLGCAGILAQLVGGILVQALPGEWGWRTCFLLSLPVCLVAIMLSSHAVAGARSGRAGMDVVGAVLLTGALGGVSAALTLGREQSWPLWSLASAIGGGACAVAMACWQAQARRSGSVRILPAGLVGRNAFTRAIAAILVFYAGVASFYFVLALDLRGSGMFSPIQVGLVFGWMGLFFVAVSSSRRIKGRLGRYPAGVGIACLGAGHLLMLTGSSTGLSHNARVLALLTGCALQGVGLGALMGSLIANALDKLAHGDASVGAGVAATTQQFGNSLGVCAIGIVYFQSTGGWSSGMAGAVVYLLSTLVLLALLLRPTGGRAGF